MKKKVHIHRLEQMFGSYTIAIQRPRDSDLEPSVVPPFEGPVLSPLDVLEEAVCLRHVCPAEHPAAINNKSVIHNERLYGPLESIHDAKTNATFGYCKSATNLSAIHWHEHR